MTLSSKDSKPGAVWDGSVAVNFLKDGDIVVRRGTPVEGVVEEAVSKASGRPGKLVLRLTSINGQAVSSSTHVAAGAEFHKPAKKTMTGWALTGALVGGLLSGGKGAAVGAAAGAGVGGLRSLSMQREDAHIPVETVLTFTISPAPNIPLATGASN